jgi:hypothetical protein
MEYERRRNYKLRQGKNPDHDFGSLLCEWLRRTPFYAPFYAHQYPGHRNVVGKLSEEVE